MAQAVVSVKIKTKAGCEDLEPPAYMSDGASGFDVRAAVGEPVVLAPGDWEVIPTGLLLEIPRGYEAQTRPRSGLAARHGITIVNSPGTIDSDYRGEVKIILANTGRDPFTIERGMRIAQVVVAPVTRVRIVPANELSETERGAGGFGHTGQ